MRSRAVSGVLMFVVSSMLLVGAMAPIVAAQGNPVPGLTGRVFPEPAESVAFIQWHDFVTGLAALESRYPDLMSVRVIGESLEGRPIFFVEVTNEKSAKARAEKLTIGYSASIHANEAAGREGMVRVIEDLASGTGPLGDLQGMLDDLIIATWFPNPDSWANGDWFAVSPDWITSLHVPSFERGNAAGLDLNRQFPNPGVKREQHTPLSEPESRAVVAELRYSGHHDNLVAGTDWHGMLNSPNMMRAIIPNQDMDFHRMMVAVRYLKDLEGRVNENPYFTEWATLAALLCLLPEQQERVLAQGGDAGAEGGGSRLPLHILQGDHVHGHGDGLGLDALTPEARRIVEDHMRLSGVWTQADLARVAAQACELSSGGPTGGVGHGAPFLWGARWDQIGYTDSGFTSDYLMLSPRSPTGGMGAVGTITEFAYSHMVPNNHYVAKLTEMHVAGTRETVRAQMEYALLLEAPRLSGTGAVAYVSNPERVTAVDHPSPYRSAGGVQFDLLDPQTWFDFNQVDYDVANTDFWADLARYSDDPVTAITATEVTAARLADFAHLVLTDATVDQVDADVVRAWVESGGNLILTDAALSWFDAAGITTDAARSSAVYLGHSDLTDFEHPLLSGVDWNARQTGEGIPVGYDINEYPQWSLRSAALEGLDFHVAGTTGDEPSLGTLRLGAGSVHFIGAALPQPSQANDHRWGLAPYAVTALTYTIFVNALGGSVVWEPLDAPFVPEYPADPLQAARRATTDDPLDGYEGIPAPAFAMFALALLAGFALLRRRR
jgi:hypothetical protein